VGETLYEERKTVDFVTSNVPGPHFLVYVSAAKILARIPFGPVSSAAANITLFRYDGDVQVGITCDAAAIPDSERLAECLEAGIDELLAASA